MATVLSVVLALFFAASGTIKLIGLRQSLEARDHLGVSEQQWRAIGALELTAVAGLLIGLGVDALGTAAASGLVVLSIGAIASHVRARDGVALMAPAVVALGLAVATAITTAS